MENAAHSPPNPASPSPQIRRRRVLFLDPSGKGHREQSHTLCQGLTTLGCEVVLGSGPDANGGAAAGYRHFAPYPHQGDEQEAGFRQHMQSLKAVRREILSFKPDAVILFSVDQPCLDRRLVRFLRKRSIRTIVCAHDVLPLESDGDVFGIYRRLYRAAERIVVFGRYARDQLVTHFDYPAGRIAVTHLGVEDVVESRRIDPATARAELGIPTDQAMILCPGRITRNKGIEDLLRAFPSVLERHPTARLWILGEPVKVSLSAYAQVAERLGLNDHVVLGAPAEQDRANAHLWLQAADVVVHPDWRVYQNSELARSCAWGRPVVATSAGGNGELLQHGKTGWLVPPRDSAALGRALLHALDDPDEARSRGEQAFLAMKKLDWASVVESLFYMVS